MYKKFRIPRKLKKKIPVGLYCYTPRRFDLSTGIYYIDLCYFYNTINREEKPESLKKEEDREFPEESIGWCNLIKGEIDDQCKNCGIKYRF